MEAWLNAIQIFSPRPGNPVSISWLTGSKTRSSGLFSPREATIIVLQPFTFASNHHLASFYSSDPAGQSSGCWCFTLKGQWGGGFYPSMID